MNFLKEHPFGVKAHFDQSLVLTYAVPAEELRKLVPAPLELDLFQEKIAFVAVALVETRAMRPQIFPPLLGRGFTLLGYRVFVRYRGADGRRRRGLFILGSETNSRFMVKTGNLVTRYFYTHVDIDWRKLSNGQQEISTNNGLKIKVASMSEDAHLPKNSPFSDWRQARRFAGPMPFTFSYDAKTHTMVTVEGVRENWTPSPIEVLEHEVPFVDQYGFSSMILANAFVVKNIPYEWKKGTSESCP
jgi:uncharacterized protein YqjF (DUF2071 family)